MRIKFGRTSSGAKPTNKRNTEPYFKVADATKARVEGLKVGPVGTAHSRRTFLCSLAFGHFSLLATIAVWLLTLKLKVRFHLRWVSEVERMSE